MKALLLCLGAVLGMFLDIKYLLMNSVKSDYQSVWAVIYRRILLLLNLSSVIPWEGLWCFCQRKRWGRSFWPFWFHCFFFNLFQDLSKKVCRKFLGASFYICLTTIDYDPWQYVSLEVGGITRILSLLFSPTKLTGSDKADVKSSW